MQETTQLKVNGLSQGPDHGSLVVLGLKPRIFWTVA